MYIRRKVFSNIQVNESEVKTFSTTEYELDENLEARIFSGNEEVQKEFGTKSKLLGAFAPGSYQAKEAAKYAYDDENDYKKVRGKYALKGLFTPGVATYMKKQAEKMAKEGKSKEEIREYLENEGKQHSNGRIAAGVAEAVTGSASGVGHAIAQGVGLYDKFTKNRAKLKKKEEKDFSEKKEDGDKKEKDNVKTAAKAAIGTGIGLHAAGTVANSYVAEKSENALMRRGYRIADRNRLYEAGGVKEAIAAGKKYAKDIANNNKVFERALKAKNGKAYKLYKGGRAAQKVGTGLAVAGIAGIAGKAIYDKVKKDKEKKNTEKKEKKD